MYDIEVLKRNKIDVNKCIEIFGNIEMYNESLKDFLNGIDAKIAKMTEFINSNRMDLYFIDVHALKSDARYLGFYDLSKIAFDLESACEKNNFEFVKANHSALIDQARLSVNIAKLYFGIAKPQEVDPSLAVASAPTAKLFDSSTVAKEFTTNVNEQKQIQVVPQTASTTIKINVSNGIRPIIKPKLMKDKILIVDDSALIIKFVNRFLQEDYEVLSASDGEQAIKLLDDPEFRSDIKLCLLDLNMPNVDGYQVLQYCKEHDYYKDLPIVVESGVEDTASLDKVNSYPIVGILLKPFKESDLRRVVEKSYATYF